KVGGAGAEVVFQIHHAGGPGDIPVVDVVTQIDDFFAELRRVEIVHGPDRISQCDESFQHPAIGANPRFVTTPEPLVEGWLIGCFPDDQKNVFEWIDNLVPTKLLSFSRSFGDTPFMPADQDNRDDETDGNDKD